jgi:hypothetical protein
MLAEDVEDHRGAIDHLDLHDVFECSALAGCQLGVGDDRVGAEGRDDVPQLLGLAAAEVGARVGMGPALEEPVEHSGARRLGECREFAERVLGVVLRALRVHADEHDVLEPQLAVLDLGDVFELGREPCDTAEGRPLLAVVLVAIGGHAGRGIRPVPLDRGRIARAEPCDAGLRLGAAQYPLDGVVVGLVFGFVHRLNPTSVLVR